MEAFFAQTRINTITLVLGHFYHNAANGPIANAAQLFKFHAPIDFTYSWGFELLYFFMNKLFPCFT
jgi:hypothetical protein